MCHGARGPGHEPRRRLEVVGLDHGEAGDRQVGVLVRALIHTQARAIVVADLDRRASDPDQRPAVAQLSVVPVGGVADRLRGARVARLVSVPDRV